jgi:D-aspartate ligase
MIEAVVCVDGLGINGLATVRSLGRRGIPVHVVCLDGAPHLASESRYCRKATKLSDLQALPEVLDAIGRDARSPPVLYVDNDRMMTLLQPYAHSLKSLFRIVEPIHDARRLTDKEFQMDMASQAGISVPRTWFPETWDDVHAIAGQTHRRILAKVSPSRLLAGPKPRFKVAVARTTLDLERQLGPLVDTPRDMLVQEYIEGDDSHVYGALAYRTRDGERSFILPIRKIRQTSPGAGVTAVGRTVDAPELRAMTQRLLERVDYRGIIHTEFKRDAETGEFFFIEWNARPGYFHSLGWQAGFDAPYLAYCDHVRPSELAAVRAFRFNTSHHWIYVHGDFAHLAKAPNLIFNAGTWAPYLSRPEWAVFADDDVKPWFKAIGGSIGTVGGRLWRKYPREMLKSLGSRLRPQPSASL